jgi:hypothetical protein
MTTDTTTPSAAFASYIDTLKEKEEQHLGYLCWYSVPTSVWVDYHVFLKLAMQLDAPCSVNKPPKPADVFLRACTATESKYKKLSLDVPDQYVNYLIRKTGSDVNWICKQIVREVVDQDNHQLDFAIIGDLRFHKHTEKVMWIPEDEIEPNLNEAGADIADAVRAYCSEKSQLLNDYAVRESFRRALEGPLKALNVRTGVYFVMPSQTDGLRSLEMFATALNGVSFHILPLVDDKKQRRMIKEAFQDESVGELERLMDDIINTTNKNNGVTESQMVAFQNRYAEITSRTKSYSGILEDNLETASAALTMCKELMYKTMGKIK